MADNPPQRGERFLSRWSRKKRTRTTFSDDTYAPPPIVTGAVVEPGETSAPAPLADVDAASLSDEEIAELEAVDIESLEYEADFARFLRSGVPQGLRQRALRQLWRSNPVLANVDGLCDYDQNFRETHTIIDTFESAYRIGKGYFDPSREEDLTAEDADPVDGPEEELNAIEGAEAPEPMADIASEPSKTSG